MTIKEVEKSIKELRKSGYGDEQILYSFAMMFLDKKINGNEFIGLMEVLGYSPANGFEDLSDEVKRKIIKEQYGIK